MIPINVTCDNLNKFGFKGEEAQNRFEISDSKTQIRRLASGTSNMLVGSTIIGEAGTTIGGSAESIDYDQATSATLNGTPEQIVRYTLAADETVNSLFLKTILEADETLNNMRIELSTDSTNFKEIYNGVPSGSSLWISIDNGIGLKIQELRLIFTGTTVNAELILLKEIQLFESVRYPYRKPASTLEYLYADVNDTGIMKAMTTFTVTSALTGLAELRVQMLKAGSYFWYNGSSWIKCSSDPKYFPYESNTPADVDTNKATLLTSGTDVEVGVRFIFLTDGSDTPVLESLEVSGT